MLLYNCSEGTRKKQKHVSCRESDRKEVCFMTTEKFCTKCGKKFLATGREVICPECKAAAQEETKRAAVLKAKRASWNGESVPVRISGRASTVIRRYAAANNLPFAEALDALLKASSFFTSLGVEWSTVQPYKSRRRDKATSAAQGKPQDVQTAQEVTSKPQDAPQTAQAAKTSKTTCTAKKAVKAAGKGGKA